MSWVLRIPQIISIKVFFSECRKSFWGQTVWREVYLINILTARLVFPDSSVIRTLWSSRTRISSGISPPNIWINGEERQRTDQVIWLWDLKHAHSVRQHNTTHILVKCFWIELKLQILVHYNIYFPFHIQFFHYCVVCIHFNYVNNINDYNEGRLLKEVEQRAVCVLCMTQALSQTPMLSTHRNTSSQRSTQHKGSLCIWSRTDSSSLCNTRTHYLLTCSCLSLKESL